MYIQPIDTSLLSTASRQGGCVAAPKRPLPENWLDAAAVKVSPVYVPEKLAVAQMEKESAAVQAKEALAQAQAHALAAQKEGISPEKDVAQQPVAPLPAEETAEQAVIVQSIKSSPSVAAAPVPLMDEHIPVDIRV